ncbi:MAG: DUF3159 domain-containing protein [Anaerolineales bacterium]|nr:DUF3159 domain-containing protein [Anaerolineales bacterium]
MNKLQELREEIQGVFAGRGIKILDVLLPLLIFLAANALIGFTAALWASIGIAVLIFLVRVFRKENLYYALGGLGGVVLAAGIAVLSGSRAGYFLPGLISGGITILFCMGSAVLKRPLAAWSSFLTRRWPLEWYWHDKIRPAYTEVTLIWALAFSARTGLEYWLFQHQAVNALGATKIFLGWPYTILILILSYLYGIWRLGKLKGPSVSEYLEGKTPPWESQKRGF